MVCSLAVVGGLAQNRSPDPDLGVGARLHGRPLFLRNDPWNQDVSRLPIDPDSAALIAGIGGDKPLHADFGTTYQGVPNGIPYVVVDSGETPPVPVRFTEYRNESDPGPYPIPKDAPVEGGNAAKGDRHVIVIDRRLWRLYELFDAHRETGGTGWRASSGAVFDLDTNAPRPAGWTSADAAGLPIFPGLVRFEEVDDGTIRHALRFTCARTRRGYVEPARHFASTNPDPGLPPMGMRVRLRAGFDVKPFPSAARVILTTLKTYGMILADNGSDWFVSGAPDPRWDDDALGTLRRVKGSDFEVVKMGLVVTK